MSPYNLISFSLYPVVAPSVMALGYVSSRIEQIDIVQCKIKLCFSIYLISCSYLFHHTLEVYKSSATCLRDDGWQDLMSTVKISPEEICPDGMSLPDMSTDEVLPYNMSEPRFFMFRK